MDESVREWPLPETLEGLWALAHHAPASAAYNSFVAGRLSGTVDASALDRALASLVARHEALRCRFPARGGKPALRVDRPARPSLTISRAPRDPRALEALLLEESRRPFDLEKGPIFRALLLDGGARGGGLALTAHHLAVDRAAWAVLLEELGALYGLAASGRAPDLPAPARGLADVIRWQSEALAGAQGERLRRHWLSELAGPLPILDLPPEREPGEAPGRTGTVPLSISPKVAGALRLFAAAERRTLYTLLLGAYQALLSRYTGQEDIVIGCPSAAARAAGFERVVANLVNTLALRADLSGRPSTRELLGRIQPRLLSALAHSAYPLARLARELNPPRAAGVPALFQTSFNLVSAHRAAALGPSRLEPLELPWQEGQFDLDVVAVQQGKGLRVFFHHRRDRLSGAFVAGLAAHYGRLLESMARAPEAPVAELPLLTPGERRACVSAGPVPRGAAELAHGLFERQARRAPDRIAVADEAGARLTYGQLDERADAVARRLEALDVSAEERVGLRLERSVEAVVGILGALKAGAAYLPLDPAFPPARLDYMLRDSGARVVLADGADGLRAEAVDEPRDGSAGRAAARAGGDRRLAYVLYTSGSTGSPKGVAVEHRSVVNVVRSIGRLLDVRETDVWLAVTTLSFDIAALELLLPLAFGARVELASRRTALDGRALSRKLEDSGATILQATPATWRLLLEAGWRGKPGLKALCGGEAWSQELGAKLLERGVQLWNVYGPTETTIWSTAARVAPGETIGLGGALDHTRLHILDRHGQPVPPGCWGELCIAGAGVARGYLNRDALTAERFVPEPGRPSSRMYRTGDRARRDLAGLLHFGGRLDHQVKVRGFRVELQEVEAALAAHPAVAAAAAAAVPRGDGEAQLVAYWVAAPGRAASVDELRAHLRPILPDYMTPSRFIALERLPLTPNGKLDRAALPAPDAVPAIEVESVAAPHDPVERVLLGIWRRVLGRPELGSGADFFEHGGDSLLAVEAAFAAEKSGVSISPADILDLRTAAAVAAKARSGR